MENDCINYYFEKMKISDDKPYVYSKLFMLKLSRILLLTYYFRKVDETELPKSYKELFNYNYPYRVRIQYLIINYAVASIATPFCFQIDNRTLEKRIFDEARYRINIFAVEDSPLFNEDEECWEIPIDYLMKPLDEDLMVGEEALRFLFIIHF